MNFKLIDVVLSLENLVIVYIWSCYTKCWSKFLTRSSLKQRCRVCSSEKEIHSSKLLKIWEVFLSEIMKIVRWVCFKNSFYTRFCDISYINPTLHNFSIEKRKLQPMLFRKNPVLNGKLNICCPLILWSQRVFDCVKSQTFILGKLVICRGCIENLGYKGFVSPNYFFIVDFFSMRDYLYYWSDFFFEKVLHQFSI